MNGEICPENRKDSEPPDKLAIVWQKSNPGIELYGSSLSNEDLGNFLTQLSVEPMFYNVVLKYAKETRISKSHQDRNALVKVIQFQIDCNTSKL